MNILLTGGGTGGHVIPLIAVAAELRKARKDSKLFWIGGGRGPEAQTAGEHNIAFEKVIVGKFRRYFSFYNLTDFFKIPIGVFQSFFLILGFKPDVVFSKGGYVSLPVIIAAFLLRKKIIIHESDLKPGLANRIGAKFAHKVLLGFKSGETKEKKFVFTGNPVRKEILHADREGAYRFFKLDSQKKIILILGGSQGARFINRLIAKAQKDLEEYQIIHLVGPKYSLPEKEDHYKPYNWLDAENVGQAYTVAQLVVARAGANTLAEIAVSHRPSILIPFPFSSADHQLLNAKVFEKEGASVVLEQENLSGKKLIKVIKGLFGDQGRLEEMGLQAKKLAQPDATDRIVSILIKACENA